MKFERVSIAAVAHELPPAELSSEAIEARLAPVYERIGLHAGRLELMTGIAARRCWSEPVTPSLVAARAGQRALDAAGLDKADIGCLVHASVCRDFLEPATASVVHERLGLSPGAQIFDLSNACLGVANAALVVASMIESGQIRAGLVVAGENGAPLVESTIRALLADETLTRKSIKGAFPSLTIGSGAAAMLLADRDMGAGHRLLGAALRTASEHNHLCRGGGAGHADAPVGAGSALEMQTDAEALLVAGLSVAEQTWSAFQNELEGFAPDKTITHQVGKAHTKALYEVLDLDRARGYFTYPWLGNVGSVSLPITLSMAVEEGFVEAGDKVGLLGIGSGLSSVMMGVEW